MECLNNVSGLYLASKALRQRCNKQCLMSVNNMSYGIGAAVVAKSIEQYLIVLATEFE